MDDPQDHARGLGVSVRDLGLRGSRGWVFRGVGVEAGPGSLIAVEGPSGSGRTCLLLVLTGRMRPTEGVAAVGGFKLPRHMSAVRRASALANVTGVTDLDPALTVGEHLRERALLQRRFGGSLRALIRPRAERRAEAALLTDTALSAAGLDPGALPKGLRTAVRDLERPEALRLSLALALMSQPRLLAVDDTDFKLSDAERAETWALLAALAESGTTVLAVCSEAPEGVTAVSTAAPSGPSTAGDEADAPHADEATDTEAAGDEADPRSADGEAAPGPADGRTGTAAPRAATDTGAPGDQAAGHAGAAGDGTARHTAGDDAARPTGAAGDDARPTGTPGGDVPPTRTAGGGTAARTTDDEVKEAADALAETGRS
ncbi:ATP-binding cassette domain-containing protein [Streptomyces sp. NPDC046831]|uniref:ATP-binding cassette domain-containing protein n=1 Tax=Streptomyces sp. NPDC046831 TaxID=3154805 RepID=UPI0033C53894